MTPQPNRTRQCVAAFAVLAITVIGGLLLQHVLTAMYGSPP